jgi:hypothetical protein
MSFATVMGALAYVYRQKLLPYFEALSPVWSTHETSLSLLFDQMLYLALLYRLQILFPPAFVSMTRVAGASAGFDLSAISYLECVFDATPDQLFWATLGFCAAKLAVSRFHQNGEF